MWNYVDSNKIIGTELKVHVPISLAQLHKVHL